MVREWLTRPEHMSWSFGVVPIGMLLVYTALMGIRSRKKGERPRRMLVWLIPAVVLFVTYFVWGFETPLMTAVAYVGGVALFFVAGVLLLDCVWEITTRWMLRSAGEGQTSVDQPSPPVTDPDCETKAEADRSRAHG